MNLDQDAAVQNEKSNSESPASDLPSAHSDSNMAGAESGSANAEGTEVDRVSGSETPPAKRQKFEECEPRVCTPTYHANRGNVIKVLQLADPARLNEVDQIMAMFTCTEDLVQYMENMYENPSESQQPGRAPPMKKLTSAEVRSKVMEYLKLQDEEGLHTRKICAFLKESAGVDEKDCLDAVRVLEGDGEIWTTVDDYTFAA